MGLRRYLRLSMIVSLQIVCFGFFVNCSMTTPFSAKGVASTDSKMGGDQGYEGKQTYVSTLVAGTCSDGSNVRSQVVASAGLKQAVLTRDECRDIAPREVNLGDFGLRPHNLDNLVTPDQFYERVAGAAEDAETVVFCRGLATSTSDQATQYMDMVDVIVKRKSDSSYTAKLIYARYDLKGELVSTRTADEGYAEYWTLPAYPGQIFFTHYVGQTRDWHLKVEPGDVTTGSLAFYDDSFGVWNFPCYRKM